MLKRTVSSIMLILLLISILTLGSLIQPARSEPRTAANNDRCDFEYKVDRDDFAYIDDDSAEFIMGLANPKQKNYDELENIVTSKGGVVVKEISTKDGIRAIVADIPLKVTSSFEEEAQAVGLLKYIEPNLKFQPALVPNDPYWQEQWGPREIEAEFAWNTTTGDSSVLVAVIDSGIDYAHSDLAANYVPLGYDWVNNDTDPMDDDGHGTHCAGIIAAELNNGIGIAGLAQVRIMAEKSGGPGGWAEDDLVNGIYHAVDQGADILSCSWGGYKHSETMYEAIKYAYDAGVLIVAAAGNDETDRKHYPAAYNEVIAVGATDKNDNRASFSNYGNWLDVAAPGVDIYSTMSKTHDPAKHYPYDNATGTSMSAPHVAGAAALVWSQFPDMTRDRVRAQLRYTADDLGYGGFDVYYGYGRVNARRAVEQAPLHHDLLISCFETPPFVKPGNTVIINITIFNFGTRDEHDITLQLLVNDTSIHSTVQNYLRSMRSETFGFPLIPTSEGIYNITLYVMSVPGEAVIENNAISASVPVRNAKVFRVPIDYPKITSAVNAAISGIGDTIEVADGIYYELITINKSVTIMGEDRTTTIIDGNRTSMPIVHISAYILARARVYPVKGVNFSGFTVRNGTYVGVIVCKSGSNISGNIVSHISRGNGISLSECSGCTLRHNKMIDNGLNFYVDGNLLSHFIHDIDTSNTVDGKPIYYWVSKHKAEVPTDAGYVAVVNSTNILARNLTLANNQHGVLFAYTTNSTVANVNALNNHFSILLYESTNSIVRDNVISKNDFGISLSCYSDNSIVEGNKVSNSRFCGIHACESSNNTISGNTMSDNQFGIWLEYGANDNTIHHNNFNNPVQASLTLSYNNKWDDGGEGNYWSDHNPPDEDLDRIGDSPYVIDGNNTDRYPLIYPYGFVHDSDVNGDGVVNIVDISTVAMAFSCKPGELHWNPIVDMDINETINIVDVSIAAMDYGKTV